jgi:hypothetical protein
LYTFKNTEQNNYKASDLETKSMLYLIGMHKEKEQIETIVVDCFNDVTGINYTQSNLWDIQSKNHSVMNPKKIGKSLFTLFDNFESSINFLEYILFIPKLEPTYLVDSSLNSYGSTNIVSKTLVRVENGLKEEYERVHRKKPDTIRLKGFMGLVIYVQDYKRVNSYIKQITKFKSNTIKSEVFYKSIFDEIRNVQASKKNSFIEEETIKTISDVLLFNRHLHKKDIHTLIINRFVGGDLFAINTIPVPFLEVLNEYKDIQDQKDLLVDCNSNICKSFFNKNDNKRFWRVTESIISELNHDSSQGIKAIYNQINGDKLKLPFLDQESLLFLISTIKNGWNDED